MGGTSSRIGHRIKLTTFKSTDMLEVWKVTRKWLNMATGKRMKDMAVRPTVQISDGQIPMATDISETTVEVARKTPTKYALVSHPA